MGEKKRKRVVDEADPAAGPEKRRVAETFVETNPPPQPSSDSAKKSGRSKQEKSERRSKKHKKEAAHLRSRDKVDGIARNPQTAELPGAPAEHSLAYEADNVPPRDPDAHQESSRKPKKEKATKNQVEPVDGRNNPSKKTDRFICFVGNLPYSATSAQVHSHFIKIADGVKSIRIGTDKKTGKGKGYAFLEFDGFDKMKTCLKLYHHSIFDPSVETEDKEAKPGQKEVGKGRRINVELTAGGGGSGKERKQKIHAKNRKLDEERERKRLKDKEQAAQDKKEQQKKIATGANGAVAVKEPPVEDRGAIHPSRLSRVAR